MDEKAPRSVVRCTSVLHQYARSFLPILRWRSASRKDILIASISSLFQSPQKVSISRVSFFLPSSLTGLCVLQITPDHFRQHHHSPTLAIDDGSRSKCIQESVWSVRVRASHLKLISCQRPQYSFHVRIENRVSTQRFLPVLRFHYCAVAIVNYECQAAENDVSIGKFCSILVNPWKQSDPQEPRCEYFETAQFARP